MRLLFALFIIFVLWQIEGLREIMRYVIMILILGLFLTHYQIIFEDFKNVKGGLGIA